MKNNTKEKEVVLVCLYDTEDCEYDNQFILIKEDYEIINNFISTLKDPLDIEDEEPVEINGLTEDERKEIKEYTEDYYSEDISYYNFLYNIFSLLDVASEKHIFKA